MAQKPEEIIIVKKLNALKDMFTTYSTRFIALMDGGAVENVGGYP